MRGDCLRMLLPPLSASVISAPAAPCQASSVSSNLQTLSLAQQHASRKARQRKHRPCRPLLAVHSTHNQISYPNDCKQLITKKQIHPRVYNEIWVLWNSSIQFWIMCPGSVAWTWSALSRPRSTVTSPWCYTGVRRLSSTTITFGDIWG